MNFVLIFFPFVALVLAKFEGRSYLSGIFLSERIPFLRFA